MRQLRMIAWIVGLGGAAGFLIGVAGDYDALRMVFKPLPVLSMAAVAAASGHRYGRTVAAGLIACVAGDVLLETGDATFLPGVAAFLVGHLCYVAAFVGETRALRLAYLVPFAAWGAVVVGVLWPELDRRGMTVPIAVYALAVCAMMWRAAARLEPSSKPSADVFAAFAGALVFAASDTLLAFDRYSTAFPGVRYAIIVFYWLGQLGITYSAARRRQAP